MKSRSQDNSIGKIKASADFINQKFENNKAVFTDKTMDVLKKQESQIHQLKKELLYLEVGFSTKIQDCNFKSKRIWKWILHFFSKQLNPRSFRSWCIKGPTKKCKICFQIVLDLRIQSCIFLKICTLTCYPNLYNLIECPGQFMNITFTMNFVQQNSPQHVQLGRIKVTHTCIVI